MKKILATLTLCSLVSLEALACPIDDETKIIPQYNRNKSMNFSNGGIDQAEFNRIIANAAKIYAPIFKKHGMKFSVTTDWEDNTNNAYAITKSQTVRKAHFPGGIARNSKMTSDAFLQVVCHEFGHHLGGFPLKPGTYASSEGQSDYFATSKCMKMILKSEVVQNDEISKNAELPEFVKDECSKQFHNNEDINICLRTSVSSLVLAKWLGRNNNNVSFETKGGPAVNKMDYEHPEANCRLETYYQGALCNVNPGLMLTMDPKKNACLTGLGVRPSCWYVQPVPQKPKPQSGDRSRNDTGNH
jgi:hypothetical protein